MSLKKRAGSRSCHSGTRARVSFMGVGAKGYGDKHHRNSSAAAMAKKNPPGVSHGGPRDYTMKRGSMTIRSILDMQTSVVLRAVGIETCRLVRIVDVVLQDRVVQVLATDRQHDVL